MESNTSSRRNEYSPTDIHEETTSLNKLTSTPPLIDPERDTSRDKNQKSASVENVSSDISKIYDQFSNTLDSVEKLLATKSAGQLLKNKMPPLLLKNVQGNLKKITSMTNRGLAKKLPSQFLKGIQQKLNKLKSMNQLVKNKPYHQFLKDIQQQLNKLKSIRVVKKVTPKIKKNVGKSLKTMWAKPENSTVLKWLGKATTTIDTVKAIATDDREALSGIGGQFFGTLGGEALGALAGPGGAFALGVGGGYIGEKIGVGIDRLFSAWQKKKPVYHKYDLAQLNKYAVKMNADKLAFHPQKAQEKLKKLGLNLNHQNLKMMPLRKSSESLGDYLTRSSRMKDFHPKKSQENTNQVHHANNHESHSKQEIFTHQSFRNSVLELLESELTNNFKYSDALILKNRKLQNG